MVGKRFEIIRFRCKFNTQIGLREKGFMKVAGNPLV
jgi:hypothetical protein